MRYRKMAYIIIGILVIAVLGVYIYFGGCKKVEFRTETLGGETMVYKDVSGDYKQTPAVTDEVYHYLLDELKIKTYKGIGIFYDNPKKAKERAKTDKSAIGYLMRSEVGCVIEPKDAVQIATIACKYKTKTLPVCQMLVAEFPYKGGLSALIGMLKVYPALEKYAKQHNLADSPITEIYDVPNKKIIYRKSL